MQPVVAAGETTSFPSTSSALTDDASYMQRASSSPAPVACAALTASTAATAAMMTQTLTRRCRPQSLTTRRCRGHVPHWMVVARLSPSRLATPVQSPPQRGVALPRHLRSRRPTELFSSLLIALPPGERRLRPLSAVRFGRGRPRALAAGEPPPERASTRSHFPPLLGRRNLRALEFRQERARLPVGLGAASLPQRAAS
jgi:hypothetical protein